MSTNSTYVSIPSNYLTTIYGVFDSILNEKQINKTELQKTLTPVSSLPIVKSTNIPLVSSATSLPIGTTISPPGVSAGAASVQVAIPLAPGAGAASLPVAIPLAQALAGAASVRTASNIKSPLPAYDPLNQIIGLYTFGNTCYFNSLIQLMFRIPEFYYNLMKYSTSKIYKKNIENLISIFKDKPNKIEEKTQVIDANKEIINNLKIIFEMMKEPPTEEHTFCPTENPMGKIINYVIQPETDDEGNPIKKTDIQGDPTEIFTNLFGKLFDLFNIKLYDININTKTECIDNENLKEKNEEQSLLNINFSQEEINSEDEKKLNDLFKDRFLTEIVEDKSNDFDNWMSRCSINKERYDTLKPLEQNYYFAYYLFKIIYENIKKLDDSSLIKKEKINNEEINETNLAKETYKRINSDIMNDRIKIINFYRTYVNSLPTDQTIKDQILNPQLIINRNFEYYLETDEIEGKGPHKITTKYNINTENTKYLFIKLVREYYNNEGNKAVWYGNIETSKILNVNKINYILQGACCRYGNPYESGGHWFYRHFDEKGNFMFDANDKEISNTPEKDHVFKTDQYGIFFIYRREDIDPKTGLEKPKGGARKIRKTRSYRKAFRKTRKFRKH